MLLPTREQTEPQALKEVQSKFRIDDAALDMRRPNRLLADLAEEIGFDFLDLLPAFAATEDHKFFEFDEHMNSIGHTAVANALERSLRAAGASEVRLLSQELAGDRYPSPSQNGKLIAYQSIRDGSAEVFLASRDFGTRRRVTFNNSDDSHPMLSSDNSRMIVTSGSAQSMRTEVVIVGLDKPTRKLITFETDVFGAIATFSHSNLKIVSGALRARRLPVPRIVS